MVNNLASIIAKFTEYTRDFDLDDWLSDEDNVVITDGMNAMMFDFIRPSVYEAHYFFTDKRGRAAIDFAKECLDKMFERAKVIRGLTPTNNKAAIWMNRHLGGSAYGTVNHPCGECQLFILTKDEWERNKK